MKYDGEYEFSMELRNHSVLNHFGIITKIYAKKEKKIFVICNEAAGLSDEFIFAHDCPQSFMVC